MIELNLELKKSILKKLNENRNEEESLECWFDEKLLSEFGNCEIRTVKELTTEDEGKYQYGGTIYRVCLNKEATDMCIMETWSRSGSYYSDYYYGYNELQPCEEYTRTIVDWKVVKYE